MPLIVNREQGEVAGSISQGGWYFGGERCLTSSWREEKKEKKKKKKKNEKKEKKKKSEEDEREGRRGGQK